MTKQIKIATTVVIDLDELVEGMSFHNEETAAEIVKRIDLRMADYGFTHNLIVDLIESLRKEHKESEPQWAEWSNVLSLVKNISED